MFDFWKVILGLIIFVGLIASPLWYRALVQTSAPPGLEKAVKGEGCIEATTYMRTSHMELLDHWRNSVARDGNRIYINTKGQHFVMSLQNTCFDCHASYENFCLRCHNYLSVAPDCWGCHLNPEYKKEKVAWRFE